MFMGLIPAASKGRDVPGDASRHTEIRGDIYRTGVCFSWALIFLPQGFSGIIVICRLIECYGGQREAKADKM